MPKRGGLKAAGKRQESATFLQRSFSDVAVQFFVCCSAASGPIDFRTAEKPMLQCSFCSAALRKLQRNFRFRLWHVAGVGFGLRRSKRCFLNGVFQSGVFRAWSGSTWAETPKCFKNWYFQAFPVPLKRVFLCRKPRQGI